MSEAFRLYGFAFPTQSGSTFSVPVFVNGDRYYVQVIDAQDKISDFEAIDSQSVDCQENQTDTFFRRGDQAVYGVRDQFNYLTFNTRDNIVSYLRSKIRHYISTPFFYRTVSEFCSEHVAEFAGCENARDYLLRQLLANFARTHKFKSRFDYYKIEKKYIASTHALSHGRASFEDASRGLHISRSKISSEDYFEFFEAYKDFIQKVSIKHKNVAKEKVVTDSMYLGSHILPSTVSVAPSGTIHEHLSLLIRQHSIWNGSDENLYHYDVLKVGHHRGLKKDRRVKLQRVLLEESTVPALSLMLFVYTISRQLGRQD
jgi:hypothetical protein